MKCKQVKKLILLGTFLIVLRSSISIASDLDFLDKFREGNDQYKQGQYKMAIEAYEMIIQNGFTSAALHYNLGNSYYKDGQIGKSILNYERAKRLNPRDGDLKSNYSYVQSLVKYRQEVSQKALFARLIQDYIGQLTRNEIAWLILVLYFLTGAVYIIGLFIMWPKKSLNIVVILLAIVLGFHIMVFSQMIEDHNESAVVLVGNEAKFEPSPNATTHFNLSEGMKVKIIEVEGLWAKVKRLDNKLGWIELRSLERI